MTEANEVEALEAELNRLMGEIASAQPKQSRLPGKAMPSGSSAKLLALNRQLATLKLRLSQSKAKAKAKA